MVDPLVRPDILLAVRILEAAWRAGRPLRRTELQRAAGVNYTIFSRYLAFLTERGLLAATSSEDEASVQVVLTAKGFEALRSLVSGMRELFGDLRQEFEHRP